MSSHGRFRIPEGELQWVFSRSSGPGGQHVNTTDTRVELRWDLLASRIIDEQQRSLIGTALKSRLVGNEIRVVSSRYRSQHRNREAAKVLLEQLVARSLVPVKRRRSTRPSPAARKRRLEAKRRHGALKASRRAQFDD